MCSRPAAVAASFGVSATSLPAQQQQVSHSSQKQQQLTAAFTWVAGGIYEKEEKEVGEQKNLKQMIKKVN